MESALNRFCRPSRAGLPGVSLEEWNAAYAKVESYFHALRVRNKVLLGQLVMHVLNAPMRRAPARAAAPATELAAEEMDQLVTDWFAQVLQESPAGTRPHAVHARPAGVAARGHARQMAGTISPPRPVARGVREAMREAYLRAGPDFQLSKMAPRPLDLGPIATLTKLAGCRM